MNRQERLDCQNAKRLLNRAYLLDYEIQALQEAKEEEHERLTSMTATVADVRVSGTHDVHKFDRYADLSEKIDSIIEEQLKIKVEILTLINEVKEHKFRIVLIDRYVRFMTWEEIAVSLGYSYQHINRLHIAALLMVAENLRKNLSM